MDKEKEIQELTLEICYGRKGDRCARCKEIIDSCIYKKIADIVYTAGYRKADEVRKETAKEILQEVLAYLEYKEYVWFRELCGKYGVER